MSYQLFDFSGQLVNLGDLQEKEGWCQRGCYFEQLFVQNFGNYLGVQINPEKDTNIYALDLYQQTLGVRADLKRVSTPYFKAMESFGLDPQHTITFNDKDKQNYDRKLREFGADFIIYIWIRWMVGTFRTPEKSISVHPMHQVWAIWYSALSKTLEKRTSHEYMQRTQDVKGNAKSSRVLDVRNSGFQLLIDLNPIQEQQHGILFS